MTKSIFYEFTSAGVNKTHSQDLCRSADETAYASMSMIALSELIREKQITRETVGFLAPRRTRFRGK